MKKYLLFVALLFLCGLSYCQVKNVDLRGKMKTLNLLPGKNIVEESHNGYQLVLEKSGNLQTWKMISPSGTETVLYPTPQYNSMARKKAVGSKKTGSDKPTSCTICYTYPVEAGEMEVCYQIPCP